MTDADTTVSGSGLEKLVGNHSLTTFATPSETVDVSVQHDDTLFRYCDQYYLAHLSGLLRVFEIETDDWMSPDQQWLTYLFGLVCVVVLAMLLVVLCKSEAIPLLHTFTAGGFETREKDSGLLYTQQENIKAYIPNEPHPFLPFPLIACDLHSGMVDSSHIGWVDPLRGHEYYNMGQDVSYLLNGKTLDRPALSVVQHWKP